MKIDKSFVMEMRHDSADYAVVRSTIGLARNLEKMVTAEGVEDHATLQSLAALGCDTAQGYYLARPMPAADCEAWLKATSRWPDLSGTPARASGRPSTRPSVRSGHLAGRRGGPACQTCPRGARLKFPRATPRNPS